MGEAGPLRSQHRPGSSSSPGQSQNLNLASSSESDPFSATKFCGDDFVTSNGNFVFFFFFFNRNSQLGLASV